MEPGRRFLGVASFALMLVFCGCSGGKVSAKGDGSPSREKAVTVRAFTVEPRTSAGLWTRLGRCSPTTKSW